MKGTAEGIRPSLSATQRTHFKRTHFEQSFYSEPLDVPALSVVSVEPAVSLVD